MSSNAESLKKAASEPSSDEPTSKKVKIKEDETKGDNGSKAPPVDAKLTKAALNGANRPGSTDKNKHEYEHDEDEDDVDGEDVEETDFRFSNAFLDPKVAKSLEEVENIQLELCSLNEKASEEILKVEQMYNKLRRPFFEKRNELLKQIPRFWHVVMVNHPLIGAMIENGDEEECLKYIVDLDIEEFEDVKSGYKLKAFFSENSYISNSVIVKEFHILDSEEVDVQTTPVEYKNTPEAQRLQRYVSSCDEEAKRSKRPLFERQPSFFGWLVNSFRTSSDEVAETLKDQVWINPLEFYFASPRDLDDDDGASDEDESDDEDEDLDDEDIDDEEDCVIPEGYEGSDDGDLDEEEEDDG